MAMSLKEKASLYKKLMADKREGIVFKLLSAPYSPNRPNSGGTQLKKKFIETASVIVLDINDDKRSIKMGVYGNELMPTFVGNCTIPPNKKIPLKGDVVEIEYLYAYHGGSLFQPVYITKRDDIDELECGIDQLKYREEVA